MAPPRRIPRQQRTVPFVVSVRCSGFRADGTHCNQLLLKVDGELWESRALAGKQEIKCPRCGKMEDFSKWQ